MQYLSHYLSPIGDILLAADDLGLTGLWLQGQKHFGKGLAPERLEADIPVLRQARAWLDLYFSGHAPDFTPTLHLDGTAFQSRVWQQLLTVPYGATVTYGQLTASLGLPPGAARAVGSAVGRNPVSLIVPCHRVIGSQGRLTGYASGLDRKQYLLHLEHSL